MQAREKTETYTIKLKPQELVRTKIFRRQLCSLVMEFIDIIDTIPEDRDIGLIIATRMMRKLTRLTTISEQAIKMTDEENVRQHWRSTLRICRGIREDFQTAAIEGLIESDLVFKLLHSMNYIEDVIHLAVYYEEGKQ